MPIGDSVVQLIPTIVETVVKQAVLEGAYSERFVEALVAGLGIDPQTVRDSVTLATNGRVVRLCCVDTEYFAHFCQSQPKPGQDPDPLSGYFVEPFHCCCGAFKFGVQRSKKLLCKHMLALLIAEIQESIQDIQIDGQQLEELFLQQHLIQERRT